MSQSFIILSIFTKAFFCKPCEIKPIEKDLSIIIIGYVSVPRELVLSTFLHDALISVPVQHVASFSSSWSSNPWYNLVVVLRATWHRDPMSSLVQRNMPAKWYERFIAAMRQDFYL